MASKKARVVTARGDISTVGTAWTLSAEGELRVIRAGNKLHTLGLATAVGSQLNVTLAAASGQGTISMDLLWITTKHRGMARVYSLDISRLTTHVSATGPTGVFPCLAEKTYTTAKQMAGTSRLARLCLLAMLVVCLLAV
jgi:hypothetical protein